ncbi:MAG: hypothetical protein KGJ23_08335 [Euryarchaeota archaeon]|nr:hypothetical protein [Euryarchaeota archaeon]MDE1836610.1 hypothetical protein [Euryarchaeota archaeon]MDE1879195.1 hypothetical protein [Euryarchaeota archaeon]MDE2044580.1 hypothetical protein [Thermoplasmata archaeon]
MAVSDIGSRLVYRDRMQNIRDAVETFRDRSADEAVIGLVSGFGHNNRKLLLGRTQANGASKFAPEGGF